MKSNKTFYTNDEGVSPIVATLVLIVVAIIGAAAVAMILGNFSGSVANQVAQSSDTTGQQASPQSISIAGSTTLYPAEVLLAKDYQTQNPLTKITVSQGGSDAGINAVGMNLVDIGASSRALNTTTDLGKYPNLKATEVAGSAVVIIYNGAAPALNKQDLIDLYTNGTCTNLTTPIMVVQRQDGSGTEETFAKYLGVGSSLDALTAGGKSDAEVGNEGILAKVAAIPGAIGFVDWGYVAGGMPNANVHMSTVDGFTASAANIKSQLKSGTGYAPNLVKHCYFITNGAPTTTQKAFINYAASPAGAASFDAAGMFGITEYV